MADDGRWQWIPSRGVSRNFFSTCAQLPAQLGKGEKEKKKKKRKMQFNGSPGTLQSTSVAMWTPKPNKLFTPAPLAAIR